MTLKDMFILSVKDDVETFKSILDDNYDSFVELFEDVKQIDEDRISDLACSIYDEGLRLDVFIKNDYSTDTIFKTLDTKNDNIIYSINKNVLTFIYVS